MTAIAAQSWTMLEIKWGPRGGKISSKSLPPAIEQVRAEGRGVCLCWWWFCVPLFSMPLVSCPRWSGLTNVTVSPKRCSQSSSSVGAVCSFSCPRGYRLIGSSSTNCTSSGTWTDQSSDVTCEGGKVTRTITSKFRHSHYEFRSDNDGHIADRKSITTLLTRKCNVS